MRLLTKKRVLLTIALLTVIGASGAYAYFTGGGSGSGTATVGATQALTITSTTSGDLTPISWYYLPAVGRPGNTSFVISNPGTHAVSVDQIVLDTSAGTNGFSVDHTHAQAGCSPADFTLRGLPLNVNQVVQPGGGLTLVPTEDASDHGAVDMILTDTGVNQDACQGATVTAYYKTN